jgi:ubiquinone/menaquinone biosynthesis C-methylase UbiE
MATAQQERWQVDGSAAELYERYTVAWMFEPLARRVLGGVRLRPGSRVLDVACGTGIVARLAAPLVAPDGQVVGVDLNDAMLACARKLSAQAGLAIEWRQRDAIALRFPDSAFDAVLCQQGLQFFPDRAGALREMVRVLAPGGTLAVAVWGEPGPFIRSLAFGLSAFAGEAVGNQCLAPYSLADATALQTLAHEAGLAGAVIRTEVIHRRIEATQEWLLRFSSGLPYGPAVAAIAPATRARMLRDVATSLKQNWITDHFSVPQDNHLLYYTKP